jgi:hypothetical protein
LLSELVITEEDIEARIQSDSEMLQYLPETHEERRNIISNIAKLKRLVELKRQLAEMNVRILNQILYRRKARMDKAEIRCNLTLDLRIRLILIHNRIT